MKLIHDKNAYSVLLLYICYVLCWFSYLWCYDMMLYWHVLIMRCHDISLLKIRWCCNLWWYFKMWSMQLLHANFVTCMSMQFLLFRMCDNDVVYSWWISYAWCGIWIVIYDVMIITKALVACWDVVIDMKSTNRPRGPVYLMISWEPILAR